jgi:type IX secretion system PorP/SprF family membrane protein
MLRYKLLLTVFAFLYFSPVLKAQDPHFSQYFASPLTLNPALTGFFDGDYRIALNERQQWWNVGSSYSTTSISADFKVLSEHLPTDDTFGVGISGLFDKTLNGALQSNYFSLSGAYHKSLADQGTQTLGMGFQVNYANRHFDYNKLTFASQFNVDFFDTSIPANVNYDNTSTNYFELNAGLLYAVHLQKSNIYAGVSLYHTNSPKESLFDASGYKIPFRSTFHSGGEININKQSSILFSGVYMVQGTTNDKLIGAAYGLKTDNYNLPVKLYLGLWHRFNQSFIPYVGMDFNNISVGLNYSMSTTQSIYYQPKTIELSLIYRHKNLNQSLLCPRF